MKKFFSFTSLQWKFTFYLSILIIVTMSILSYWNISREKRLLKDSIIREGKALVESLAISCTNTILYEEIGLIEEGGLLDNYISDLMERKDLRIIYAMILDPKGKVIAHNSMIEVGNSYQDELTERILNSRNTLIQFKPGDLVDISTPLAISTKHWGNLRIGISLENLKKEISSLILRYIFYTCIFVIFATIIITILFGFITKPLKSLALEMDETKPGDEPLPHHLGIMMKSVYFDGVFIGYLEELKSLRLREKEHSAIYF